MLVQATNDTVCGASTLHAKARAAILYTLLLESSFEDKHL